MSRLVLKVSDRPRGYTIQSDLHRDWSLKLVGVYVQDTSIKIVSEFDRTALLGRLRARGYEIDEKQNTIK